jgi:hypothetical protein
VGDDHPSALSAIAQQMRHRWVAALALAVAIGVAIGLGAAIGSGDDIHQVLAYVRGAAGSAPQVWLADGNGLHARRLGPGASPLVSPDGTAVAASAPGLSGAALTLYSTTGSSPRRFFDAARATAMAESWSPDSRYLAVVLASTNPNSDASSGLAVIDATAERYRVIARGPIDGASFAPDGSDRLAYASAAGLALASRVDIHVADADGSAMRQLTHDGRSLNPVWGRNAIALDHERLRNRAAPAYQVWTVAPDGSHPRQLTDLRIPPLLNGLVPIGFSADGGTLLAEYEGLDTSQAWTVTLATGASRALRVGGHTVTAGAVSRQGASALVDLGGYLNPPDQGVIEAVPLGGGRAAALAPHGAQPSWNR